MSKADSNISTTQATCIYMYSIYMYLGWYLNRILHGALKLPLAGMYTARGIKATCTCMYMYIYVPLVGMYTAWGIVCERLIKQCTRL